jgi:uncharacterized protein (TIGR00251 family)
MNVEIRDTPDGATLAVRAQPGAKKDKITGLHDGSLKVAVSAPPEDGRANEAIIRLLADTFDCRPNRINLQKGKTDRRKVFLFEKISAEELRKKVESIVASPES